MSQDAATIGQLNGVIENIVKAIIPLAAVVSIVMIAIGGFHYFMAGGDKEGAAKAQKTLTFAIAGLILSLSSWLILSLIGNFLGINIGRFDICFPGFTGPNCT